VQKSFCSGPFLLTSIFLLLQLDLLIFINVHFSSLLKKSSGVFLEKNLFRRSLPKTCLHKFYRDFFVEIYLKKFSKKNNVEFSFLMKSLPRKVTLQNSHKKV